MKLHQPTATIITSLERKRALRIIEERAIQMHAEMRAELYAYQEDLLKELAELRAETAALRKVARDIAAYTTTHEQR